MALSLYKTSRFARVYREDTAGGHVGFMKASISPMHYESVPETGSFDTAIDLIAAPETTADYDGDKIVDAPYEVHSQQVAPGSSATQPNNQPPLGTTTFVGRHGKSIAFTMVRLAYRHKTTGAQTAIGSDFNYSTGVGAFAWGEVTRDLGSHVDAPSEVVRIKNNGVWPSVSSYGGTEAEQLLTVRPERIDLGIKLPEAAEVWITANDPPPGPSSEYDIGPIVQVDLSDVGKVEFKDGSFLYDMSQPFDDSTGGLKFYDRAGRLIAYLPSTGFQRLTFLNIGPSDSKMTKRFYSSGGVNYMHYAGDVDIWRQLTTFYYINFNILINLDVDGEPASFNEIAAGGYAGFEKVSEYSHYMPYASHYAGRYYGYELTYGGLRFHSEVPGGASVTNAGAGEYANVQMYAPTDLRSTRVCDLDIHCDISGSHKGIFNWTPATVDVPFYGSGWESSSTFATQSFPAYSVYTTDGQPFPIFEAAYPFEEWLGLAGVAPGNAVGFGLIQNAGSINGGYHQYMSWNSYNAQEGHDSVLNVYYTWTDNDLKHNHEQSNLSDTQHKRGSLQHNGARRHGR